jgi:hypothetical protein
MFCRQLKIAAFGYAPQKNVPGANAGPLNSRIDGGAGQSGKGQGFTAAEDFHG